MHAMSPPSYPFLFTLLSLLTNQVNSQNECLSCIASETCFKSDTAPQAAADDSCTPCAPATSTGGTGQNWWPCSVAGQCECRGSGAAGTAKCNSISTPTSFCDGDGYGNGLIDSAPTTNCAAATCDKANDAVTCCKPRPQDCAGCAANEQCYLKTGAPLAGSDAGCAPCAPSTSTGGAGQTWSPCNVHNQCMCQTPPPAKCSSISTPATFCDAYGNGLKSSAPSTNCLTTSCNKADDAITCCKPVTTTCDSISDIPSFCGIGNGLIGAASTTDCQSTPCVKVNDASTCCISFINTPTGKYSLASSSVTLLITQVIVDNGNLLEISGQETIDSNLAVIKQVETADLGVHRLFWVKYGELKLKWVRLLGGKVKANRDDSLPGLRACSGGLIYVGDVSAILSPPYSNENGKALLNATGVIFADGLSAYGGALAVVGSQSFIVIDGHSQIIDNNAYDGGGIHLSYSSSFKATDTTIQRNKADKMGGAIYAYQLASVATTASIIQSNSAGSNGGGVYLRFRSLLIMLHSEMVSNIAEESGGGIYADSPPVLSLKDSTFASNTAKKGNGGGAYVTAALNTGDWIPVEYNPSTITIDRSTFSHNLATGTLTSNGGGMSLTNIDAACSNDDTDTNCADHVTLTNTKFIDNVVNAVGATVGLVSDAFQTSGGGLHLGSIDTTVLNFITSSISFVRNIATDGVGGGVTLFDVKTRSKTDVLKLINFKLDGNVANKDGGGLALLGSTSVQMVEGSLFKNNVAKSKDMKVKGWRATWYKSATSIPLKVYRDATIPDREEILAGIQFDVYSKPNSFQTHWGKGNNFGAHFTSVLRPTVSGVYTFRLLSDDGSVLKIDGEEISRVNGNRGGPTSIDPTQDGTKNLVADTDYVIDVGYFDVGNTAWLTVLLKGPGEEFQHVHPDLTTSIDSSTRGGGLYVSPLSCVEILGPATFDNNTANGGDGGAVYLDQSQGSVLKQGMEIETTVTMKKNVAKSRVHRSKTIGNGKGGGMYAYRSQIGSVEVPTSVLFQNNVPSGIHSFRSSMFFAAPMSLYQDSIVVGVGDFPFPVPQCPEGKWFPANANDPWKNLPKSSNGVITGTEMCYNCPTGYENLEIGAVGCSKCQRGRYQNQPGSRECQACPGGWLQENEGQSFCDKADSHFIVLGGATSYPVPDGSYLKKCQGNACDDFDPCPSGWMGNKPPTRDCKSCMAGKTSTPGALTCSFCAKGKFSKSSGQSKCTKCISGMFQSFDTEPSTTCTECPSGYDTEGKTGESTCQNLGYVTKEDCNIEQYLNDENKDQSKWKCETCPPGGSCINPITKSEVKAKFGWSHCVGTNLTFEECSFPGACKGGPNFMLVDKFPIANNDTDEMCNDGYVAGSRLCGQCAPNFSMSGAMSGGKCDECLDAKSIRVIAVVGMLMGMLAVFVYIQITLADGGDKDESDGAKSIGLSFIQLIALLVTFPIAWPPIFTAIFQVGGAITVLGQNLVNLKCMNPNYPGTISEAEVFYIIRIAWAAAPPILLILCVLTWVVVDQCKCAGLIHACSHRYCRKKHSLQPQTTFYGSIQLANRYRVQDFDEKVKMSCVSLLYLVWPSLCATTFSIFSCRNVCNDVNTYLRADLNEMCWSGRHQMFVYALGLPMLFVYIIGFPLAAYFRIKKLKSIHHLRVNDNSSRKDHRIYGLFFSAFRKETWWWEGTIAFRKILIALIGVFGAGLGAMQVHLTLMLVMLIILMTARVRPFGGLKHGLNHELEIASLMATFLTLWAGTVFNTYPKCQDPSKSNGETLLWCDALSITAGVVDILVVVAVIVIFIYLKLESLKEDESDIINSELTVEEKEIVAKIKRRQRDSVVIEMIRSRSKRKNNEIVNTFMGKGEIIQKRKDGVNVIQLDSGATLYMCRSNHSGDGEMKSDCGDGSAVLVGSSMKTMHASRRDTSTLLPAVAMAIQHSSLSDVFEEEEE